MWLILMVAIAQPEAQKIRVKLEPGTVCATAVDAAREALADAEKLDYPEYARYVWIPDDYAPQSGYAQASLIANSTFSRTPNIVRPESVFGGRLVRFQLEGFVASESKLAEIVTAYERLAKRETYFGYTDRHAVIARSELQPGDACEVRVGDQWQPGKFAGNRPNGQAAVDRNGVTYVLPLASVRSAIPPGARPSQHAGQRLPAAHLGDVGRRLFFLTSSDVPIIRLDEFVALAFSSINGGEYYALCGVETDLQKTVARFMGADAANKLIKQTAAMREADAQHRKEGGERSIYEIAAAIDPDLTTTKWLKTHSDVTGRSRSGLVLTGTAMPPGKGTQRGHFTFDISEDNTNPDSDPNRNLLNFERYDGGEGIIERDNGTLLYLVWDAQDRIIASVPDNVAHDYRARQVRANAATTRVFAGVSCAVCHDWTEDQMGWQPITNDMARSLKTATRFIGDKESRDRAADVQRLISQYSTDDLDFRAMLDDERRQYQRAVQRACGTDSRSVVMGWADSYWGHWYDAETPETFVRHFGQVLAGEKAQTWLFENLEPADDTLGDFLREDLIIARLKEGSSITPVQSRTIYGPAYLRVLEKQTRDQ